MDRDGPRYEPGLPVQSASAALAGRARRLLWFLLFLALGCVRIRAAEVIPPAPAFYFNDYAGVTSADTASRLNKKLEDFERETSNQILVAVYPHMQSESSIEDYTVRVAQAWKVGQKQKKNGAVLFVFTQDRKMYLQVGYGLEGALPDALAKQIIENELKPRFRNGDFDGGLSAGVDAILAATKGEYKGTGRTVADQNQGISPGVVLLIAIAVLVVLALLLRLTRFLNGVAYSRRGYSAGGCWPIGGGGWSGGGWSGGGGWGGGGGSSGGGFSGGGGSFGGGGAGGSW
jgi:uncharacterized protein